jgi:pre-mRNA-splicing helicase BRR2
LFLQNSNLVLQADTRLIERRNRDEATGEVVSLAGHISDKRMGDKYQRTRPTGSQSDDTRRRKKHNKRADAPLAQDYARLIGKSLVNESADDLDDVIYRPKTAETKQTYEILLSILQESLGDVERKVLGGAADEILFTMKDDKLKEKDRRKLTNELLGRISDETYTTLVNLCKKITDFGSSHEPVVPVSDDRIDEEFRVNVLFESDEEGESDFDDEVRDEDDDQADGIEDETDQNSGLHASQLPESSSRKSAAGDSLSARDIDAYWLQRKLNKMTGDDPVAAREKANKIVEILQSASDTRDLENQLVLLLSYEQFEFIKLLCKNRFMILYCTLLASAQTPQEKRNITSAMAADPALSRILKQLEGMDSEIGSEREHQHREAESRKGSHQMEVDEETAGKISKCKILDLDELSFSQGSHLMANKKCDLPEGSQRIQCSGYDEIYVPPLKPKPFDRNEVSVSKKNNGNNLITERESENVSCRSDSPAYPEHLTPMSCSSINGERETSTHKY